MIAAGPNGSATVLAMSTASVLIAADRETGAPDTPRYSLLLSTDPDLIDAAQRLRHQVFTSEPGFTLTGAGADFQAGRDADRFDEYCDHLLVRDDDTGELVGCYRMLPPPGAIAAGGLYTATEFDVTALDPLRPSLVEMGRAVVRDDHRNGAVVLLMWAGILAYLDRCDYDYVTGCVSVPVRDADGLPPGSRLRGVRDFVARRHAAPAEYRVHPYRPVVLDGRTLDDIDPPARLTVPPLMRGYLRLGAQVCGEPAHDPDFGVGDFPALLDKRQADTRYLRRLRSVSAAAEMANGLANELES
jgi:putative hemolysin